MFLLGDLLYCEDYPYEDAKGDKVFTYEGAWCPECDFILVDKIGP